MCWNVKISSLKEVIYILGIWKSMMIRKPFTLCIYLILSHIVLGRIQDYIHSLCVCVCVCVHMHAHTWLLSHVQLFATPWAAAYQGPLSMGFSRQEYWSGLPFSAPGIFLTQGSNPRLLHLLRWQANSLPLSYWGSPMYIPYNKIKL